MFLGQRANPERPRYHLGPSTPVSAFIRLRDGILAKKITGGTWVHSIAFFCLLGAFVLVSFPFLLHDTFGMRYLIPVNYDEGWNAIHTSRLHNGGSLYGPVAGFPLTPVNYPPLSFLIVSVLSYVGRDILLTGRVVSLVSFLFVTYLIFRIIANLTSGWQAPLLGSLVWLALIARMSDHYVGMYEPQMLGHVFSLGALYLYSRWGDDLDFRQTCVLAALCCFGLFIKLIFVAVPITIATTLLVRNRARFWTFSFAGAGIFSLMLLGGWLYGGNHLFSNFLELDREWSALKALSGIQFLLHWRLFVLLLPFALLPFRWRRKRLVILPYFVFSFLIGAFFAGGEGVSKNAWFDFFIAGSLVIGLLAAEWMNLKDPLARIAVYGVLVSTLLPFPINLRSLERVLDYNAFAQDEKAYRQDVELLRSIPGPALFEDPLLGFAAGKEFLFDPFAGSQMIASGRVPERVLTDRIRERYFGAIVLSFDLEEMLGRIDRATLASLKPGTLGVRWTGGTLKAASENYKLLDGPPRYYLLNHRLLDPRHPRYYFYLPRRSSN